MKIADIHAHIFPDHLAERASASIAGFYNAHCNHKASLSKLLVQQEQAGITVTAVSSSATSPAQASHINTFIAESVREHPGLVGFGSLFPTMEGWEPELERMVALGLKGIKIHPDFQKIPIDEPKAVEMYRGIAKAGLPILFHMGDARYDYSTPERLENLLRQVPDLVAIAAHFGGWQAWDHAYDHVLPENVYYDTSSSLMFLGRDRTLEFLDKMGADRFIFGSDFPMWTPKVELQRVLDLGLDDSTLQKVLYGNFETLFLK